MAHHEQAEFFYGVRRHDAGKRYAMTTSARLLRRGLEPKLVGHLLLKP